MKTKTILAKAVSTSMVSKAVSAVYQFASLPLIMIMLDKDQFGYFTVLVTLVGWVNILQGGVSPSLTRVYTRSSNLELKLNVLAVTRTILLLFAVSILLSTLISNEFINIQGDDYHALVAIILLSLFSLLLSPAESVRLGNYEQHVNNLFYSFAQLVTIFSLYAIYRFSLYQFLPVVMVVFCIYLPPLLSKGINSYLVFRDTDSNWWISPLRNRKLFKIVSMLIISSIFIQISGMVIKSISVFYLANKSMEDVGKLEVVFRFLTIAGTFYPMIQAPLWPLIVRARKSNDKRWLKNTLVIVVISFSLFGALVFTLLHFFGEAMFSLWLGKEDYFTVQEMEYMAYYFLAVSVAQSIILMLMGFERFHEISKILLIEAVLFMVVISILTMFVEYSGISGVLAPMIALRFLVCIPLGYYMMRSELWVK